MKFRNHHQVLAKKCIMYFDIINGDCILVYINI